MCGSNCNCSRCIACKLIGGLACLVLAVTTVASLVGAYRTHVLPAGLAFGSVEGSLALLTLIASVAVLVKTFRKMCPCGSKGCGCGGGNCVCPKCGSADCQCK